MIVVNIIILIIILLLTILILLIIFLYNKIYNEITILKNAYKIKKSYISIKKFKEKPRRRYIIIEIDYSLINKNDENKRNTIRIIEKLIRDIVGEIGLVNMGINIVDYNPTNNRLIIKAYHNKVDEILGVIGILNMRGYLISVIDITGSLKNARKKAGLR